MNKKVLLAVLAGILVVGGGVVATLKYAGGNEDDSQSDVGSISNAPEVTRKPQVTGTVIPESEWTYDTYEEKERAYSDGVDKALANGEEGSWNYLTDKGRAVVVPEAILEKQDGYVGTDFAPDDDFPKLVEINPEPYEGDSNIFNMFGSIANIINGTHRSVADLPTLNVLREKLAKYNVTIDSSIEEMFNQSSSNQLSIIYFDDPIDPFSISEDVDILNPAYYSTYATYRVGYSSFLDGESREEALSRIRTVFPYVRDASNSRTVEFRLTVNEDKLGGVLSVVDVDME